MNTIEHALHRAVEVPVAPTRQHRLLVLVAGLVGGLSWGAIARLWMRFISDDPEFSWSGTSFIVIAFGLFGLGQAVALMARRAGWRRPGTTAARTAGAIGMLPIFGGAGAMMFPTVFLGGLAWARREWHGAVRVILSLLAAVIPTVIAVSLVADLGWLHGLAGTAGMAVIYGVVIVAAGATMARQPDGWHLSRRFKIAAAVGAVLLVAVVRLGTTGL